MKLNIQKAETADRLILDDFSTQDFPAVLAYDATPGDNSGNTAASNVQDSFSLVLLPMNPAI
jgi:hypothetical protein